MRSSLLSCLLLACAAALSADIGSAVSTDFDAEFACAADTLEAGQRAEAERVFGEIVRLSGQPAWDIRAAFVLAADDERHGDTAAAAARLSATSAETIGLEAYRRLWLARLYQEKGKLALAQMEARLAFATEGPFAYRPQAALRLARLLEASGRIREASETLKAGAAGAESSVAETIAAERIRLALVAGDAATARALARELLLSGTPESRLPPSVRPAVRREAATLSRAERGRRGRALLASGDAAGAAKLLAGIPVSAWAASERAENLLALAEAQRRLKRLRSAEKTLGKVPDDGTEASCAAKLLAADLRLTYLRSGKAKPPPEPDDSRFLAVGRTLTALTEPAVPLNVRSAARERLVRLTAEQGRFEDALAQAREYVRETLGASGVFEPLWKLAWQSWLAGDQALFRQRLQALEALAPEPSRLRRLKYWTARSLLLEGRRAEAATLLSELAASDPADLYGQFAKRRVTAAAADPPVLEADPATGTAAFRVPDELMRVRLFEEAAAEARRLPPSRGRDLRLAQAEFAQGHFFASVVAVKRAFPQLGTAEEASVPDPWRRLYYPIDEGGIVAARAKEAGVDAALLRAIVRQESLFDPRARSRAGAIGLMQLEPATARSLSSSVLRARYRRAFLYDPSKNATLGAAYFKRLVEQFGGSVIYALAAYNGGPPTMDRVLSENAGRDEDEVLESHPYYETRDYVRRVLLYAEAYRQLYP
jgi:soluble lytic murein transglycosylase-like protein